MKILIYSRKGIYNWSCSFKKFLFSHDISSEIITELTFDGDIILGEIFNHKLAQSTDDKCVFNEIEINDIILRCRLLRSFDIRKAKKMVITYTNILEKILEQKKITHFISVRVDNYFLDIVFRLSLIKSFKFIGLWKNAIVKNKIFFTAKGEFNFIENSENENLKSFIQILNSDTFKATSLKEDKRPSIRSSLMIFLISYFRAFILLLLGIIYRDYNGYRYLTTPFFVKDYKLNFKNIFSHLLHTKNWEDALLNVSINKKLFIGLQVNPEATIDYYVDDIKLINIENVINIIIDYNRNSDVVIFIKDHPNMLGKRNYNFLKKLSEFKNVYLIPSYINSNYIINHVDSVFTWSGTIGLQAAIRGKCSIIVKAPYYHESFYYKVNNYDDLKKIPYFLGIHKYKNLTDDEIVLISKKVTDSLIDGNMNFKDKSLSNLDNTFSNILKYI